MHRAPDVHGFPSSAIVLFSALLALASPGCGDESIPMPQELVGTYEAADPRYADRYLTLTDSAIVLGVGDGESERHRIRTVLRSEEAGRTVYTVEYLASYGRDSISFFERDGAISLTSQPDVRWTRGEVRQ